MSIDYTTSAEEVLIDALYLCEALEEGEPVPAEALPSGLRALNRLLMHLKAVAGHQWLMTEGTLFCEPDRAKYTLGKDEVFDHAAQGDEFGVHFGVFTVAAPSTTDVPATSLDVDDATEIKAGYWVAFRLPGDDTYTWRQVDSISGNQLLFNQGVGEFAEQGLLGYWVRELAERPSVVLSARRGTYNGAEIPMDVVGRETYKRQPNKDTTSQPVMLHYAPQRDTGEFFLWPRGGHGNVVRYTCERAINVIENVSDTLDVPEEWFDAIVYGLAARIAPQYAVPIAKRQLLERSAAIYLDSLMGYDQEGEGFVVTVGV